MPRAPIAEADTATAPTPKRRGRPPRLAPDVMQSPRKETQSTDFQIGQPSPIKENTPRNDVSREKSNGHRLFGRRLSYDGDLILLTVEGKKIEVTEEYLAELAFYEDPIKIIINPSTHKNAASIFENWSNGMRAEMWINNQWVQVGDLPVGRPITIKRKIAEHIIRARITEVRTIYESTNVENPRNEIGRTDSRVHSFTVLHDASPKAQEWLEMAYARPH